MALPSHCKRDNKKTTRTIGTRRCVSLEDEETVLVLPFLAMRGGSITRLQSLGLHLYLPSTWLLFPAVRLDLELLLIRDLHRHRIGVVRLHHDLRDEELVEFNQLVGRRLVTEPRQLVGHVADLLSKPRINTVLDSVVLAHRHRQLVLPVFTQSHNNLSSKSPTAPCGGGKLNESTYLILYHTLY